MSKQVPAQEGLAETDFPRQHGKSAAGNAKSKMIQGFQMMAAGKKEIGIRCQPEWRF
jgi:hypothetical protein